MADTVKWDLTTKPTAWLLDMLHEYAQAHAAVSDKKTYEHPDAAHFQAHFYNLRFAVAKELERRGYKDNILPLIVKSITDIQFLLLQRPPVDWEYLAAHGFLSRAEAVVGKTCSYTLHKALGPGERWITVHPHGDSEPGIPVLIRETPDGVGTIISGAGGSLNFVKLSNLKTPAEYREHAKQRAQEKRKAEQERLAGMSPEEREQEQTQKGRIDEEKRQTEDTEVAKVYQMMGYEAPKPRDPEELAKENNISVPAAKIALARERQAHIAAVRQLASAVRETLIDDHEAAAEAGLGDISLSGTSDGELWGTGKESMELLQPPKSSETSGIKADFPARAAGAGASRESMGEEGKLIKERARQGQDSEQRQFSERISQNIKDWNAQAKELEATGQVKQNVMKITELPEAGKMLNILKADRALSQARATAQQAKEETKRGVQTRAFVAETSEGATEAIQKQFSQEAELAAVRGMLSRVENEQGLTRHVRNAAFDTLNEVGLTLSGSELMGREVVDFLGSAGAAQLLAQRLKNTLSDEDFEATATAVAEMHGRENAARAQRAMDAADEELKLAKELEVAETEEPMDVVAARALNEQRMEHLANAREILGDSYGRLAAMGELSLALKGAVRGNKEITCDMGATPKDQAITMARSFGLNPEVTNEDALTAEKTGIDLDKIGAPGEGDYRIESGGGKTMITLKSSALGKVVSAFNPEDTKEYAAAQQIKQGAHDEPGWLPAGIEKRAASTFDAPTYELSRFDSKLVLPEGKGAAGVETGLKDYIGAKMGEGYPLDALREQMGSEAFKSAFVPEGHRAHYDASYAKLLGKPGAGLGDEQAREFSKAYKRRQGMTDAGELDLNTQRLPIREKPAPFMRAAHQTLADLPEAAAAFTPLGELSAADRKSLQAFHTRAGGGAWEEHVAAMGSEQAAYENTQASLKGMAVAQLAKHHGGLQVGRVPLPNAAAGDRPTVGQDAEAQLAAVWGNTVESKQKQDLVPDVAMEGKTIKQQRAVKLALRQKRLGLHMGAGSGKTLVSVGTFTQAHAEGKAHKAIFAVPSTVQAEFGEQMQRFTTPGRYQWLSDPKATREERMAAYKDDTTHMVVATHHAFRDDLMHAVAEHTQKSPKQIARAFKAMSPEARREATKAAMDQLGWKVDFAGIDESHGILNRAGKPDSAMANAIDAFTYHMPHMLSMTGTPVKNDASEAFDTLAKLDPHRFTDRDSFLRKYGVNTPTNHASLQRLMGRYVYADRISSGVERMTDERKVPLHPEQQKEYSAVMSALNKVRRTRRSGKADIDAVKVIAPNAFDNQPEEAHQRIANEVAKVGLGGRLNARLLGVVNGSNYEHNAKINAMREDLQRDKDKPHVIFAHHYKSVGHVKKLCDELGMRVGVISGDMSASKKAQVRKGFQPAEGQEPQYDVLLNTDAGSTGQNLQRGSVLLNYDTPDTAANHEQRCARIDRIGQKQNVTVRDYVTDTPIERAARKRLATKRELADVFQSPSELLDDTGLSAEIQRVRAEKRNQPQVEQQEAA